MMTNKQNGFTLIEIMIALLIGIFLTAGVAKIFLNTKQTNRMQENLSRMQENARFAMAYLAEDVRQSDYWGGDCVEAVIDSATSHINTGTSAYMADEAKYTFDAAMMEDAVSGAQGTVDLVNTALDSSDTLSVKGLFRALGGVQVVDTSGAEVNVSSNSGIKHNDLVLVTNCAIGDIFQVINSDANIVAGANDTLDSAVGGTGLEPGNGSGITNIHTSASRVFNLSGERTRTYTINASEALQRGGDALVDDIENMQITYGVQNGDNLYYAPWSAALALDADNIVSIEISILVRSKDDNLTTAPQSYTYNGGTVTATDRRLRKVYTSRIFLRNRAN